MKNATLLFALLIGLALACPASAQTSTGNLNGDSVIDVVDLGIFLSNWGATNRPPSDFNQSGLVDVVDLAIILGNWGAVSDGSIWRFVVAGDTRSDHNAHREVVKGVANIVPNNERVTYLNSGDITADGVNSQWDTWENIVGIGQSPLNIDRSVKNPPQYIGAVGNHDAHDPGWQTRWQQRLPAQVGLSAYSDIPAHSQGLYGSAIHDNALFMWIDDESRPSGQDNYIDSVLSRAASDSNIQWKFVISHQPPLPCGSKSDYSQGKIWNDDYFVPYGVDIWFQGHAHYYTRSCPLTSAVNETCDSSNRGNTINNTNGVIHVVAGGGGAPLYSPTCTATCSSCPSLELGAKLHGFLEVEIDGNMLNARAWSTQNGGDNPTIYDQFTITKNKSNPSIPSCTCSGTTCEPGNTGRTCNGCNYVNAPAEVCNNSIDDNCDGLIDENCQTEDKTYTILRTPVPPVMDGSIHDFSGANTITLSNANGTIAAYRLLYDNSALYVSAEVTDTDLNALITSRDGSGIWNDDSIEIFFDTLHNAGTNMDQNDDYKFLLNLHNTQYDSRFDISRTWNTSWSSQVFIGGTLNSTSGTDYSYNLEFAIPWSSWGINPPNAGTTFGFDVNMNDRNDAGTRIYTAWANTDGGDLNSPTGWGDLVFSSQGVSGPADDPPVVNSFSVTPATIDEGQSITASYSATDDLGLALAELYRAPYVPGTCVTGQEAGCSWSVVNSQGISGTSYSGQISNTPPAGEWLYGAHVTDTSGLWVTEGSFGPDRVTVDQGPIVNDPRPAYYVSNSGNDSYNGQYPTYQGGVNGPWRTIQKVENTLNGRTNSTRVYFRCGDTWDTYTDPGGLFSVNWGGSACSGTDWWKNECNNYAVLGAYYMNNSTVIHGVSGNRPLFVGRLPSNYRDSSAWASYPSGFYPTTQEGDIITVRSDYVSVKDIKIQNSGGHGIKMTQGAQYGRYENMVVDKTVGSCVKIYDNTGVSKYYVVKDSTCTETAIAYYGTRHSGGAITSWPGALGGRKTRHSYFKGNLIDGCYGECISPGPHSTVIENVCKNVRSAILYLNGSYDVDIKRNLVVGTSNTDYHWYPGFTGTGGITFGAEGSSVWFNVYDVNISDNVIINVNDCIKAYDDNPTYSITGSVNIINNTCLSNKRGMAISNTNGDLNNSHVTVKNNLFYTDSASSEYHVGVFSNPITQWTVSNNYFDNSVLGSVCGTGLCSASGSSFPGIGNVSSGATVIPNTTWRGNSNISNLNFTSAQLAPDSNSSTIGQGYPAGADFDEAWSHLSPLPPNHVITIQRVSPWNIGAVD